MTSQQNTELDAAIVRMSEIGRDVLQKEANRLRDAMTEYEILKAGTSDGVFHANRLARVLVLLAAQRKLEAELGYEAMGPVMRLAKRATKRL